MNDFRMTPDERKATWGLGTVFSLRMLGMFMVLPVLTTYGMSLSGASETLIGLAIGIYGITQALFQIPFGIISDRVGRKPLIVAGLLIFAFGSAVAAMTDSIWGVILGRALQGAGAIAAALMALLSDLTREQNRTKAMAFIGVSFGVTFAIAMVAGPLVTHALGLSGLFGLITLLALLGIAITLYLIPAPTSHLLNRDASMVRGAFGSVLLRPALLRLNAGIMCVHILLMSSFIALPPLMEQAGLARGEQWKVYLCTMLIAFITMVPFIIYAEKQRRMKQVFQLCVVLMIAAEVVLWYAELHLWGIILGIQLFFFAFNMMEALLPSLISKESPPGYKGTAMGVYSTCQFIGVAIGGILGGIVYARGGAEAIFTGCAVLAVMWFVISLTMKEPPYVSSLRIVLPPALAADTALACQLRQQPGVNDVMLIADEHTAYIKIDSQVTSREALETFLQRAAERGE
ncbi:MFS transporter [Edwardsiella piscicida]|uniref:Transporter, major facilitator family n=3 Tax=Edwardsiella TaxID=635 RepID=A0AAU8PNR6_EDWPI|nr:MFS transporter [Edwardsiella piscicida]ACY83831.1 putative transporter, major facilitator family [Edwardsiella tarda EIB202]ADM41038.1 Putative transport protein [Edwardsiella tarda FL6-60]AOP42426.1 MFS transporter [Edwardsiella piscicida]ARD17397.1 MFS transporter [Edwardsiella piscicida]EKS7765350.1 MFS transporter [Edwardsiella piscicida]